MLPLPIWSVLITGFAIGLALRDLNIIRSAGVLLTNWIVLTTFATYTGDQFYIPVTALVDYVSMWALFLPPRSRGSVALVLTYAVEIVFHVTAATRLLLGSPEVNVHWDYWWQLHYVAWTQAFLLIGWGAINGGRRLGRPGNHFLRGMHPVAKGGAVARSSSDRRKDR